MEELVEKSPYLTRAMEMVIKEEEEERNQRCRNCLWYYVNQVACKWRNSPLIMNEWELNKRLHKDDYLFTERSTN